VGAVFIAFFTVPLPVSRVRQVALVQLQDDAEHPVLLREDGRLDRLTVHEGQFVHKDDVLAVLTNRELQRKWDEAETQCEILRGQIDEIGKQLNERGNDNETRSQLNSRMAQANDQLIKCEKQLAILRPQLDALVLRAPADGWVINPPRPDEVGKTFDHQQPVPFCTIGDPDKLRVLVPVKPSDYRLLRDDRNALKDDGKDLPITIRIHGRDSHTWKGEWTTLPEAEARTIPPQLSNKGGGPIPVKPGNDPNKLEPISQQYVLSIAIDDPDKAICPGSMGQVKIECRWRSAAWWVWRTVNDTFDLGLM